MAQQIIMDSIDKYQEAIEKLAISKEPMYFANSGAHHAAIVMSNIFRTSEYTIRLFSGSLNGDISNDEKYLAGLEKFLMCKGKLFLLLEQIPSVNSKAFALIKQYMEVCTEHIQIKLLDQDIFDKANKPKFHFTVGDDRMFRFEKDPVNYSALCSFNDPNISKKLIGLFDNLFVKGSSI